MDISNSYVSLPEGTSLDIASLIQHVDLATLHFRAVQKGSWRMNGEWIGQSARENCRLSYQYDWQCSAMILQYAVSTDFMLSFESDCIELLHKMQSMTISWSLSGCHLSESVLHSIRECCIQHKAAAVHHTKKTG